MVLPHTSLSKVPWVIFVEVDPVVMHATSITWASWVLLMPACEAMAMAHVAQKFPGSSPSGWHVGSPDKREGGQYLHIISPVNKI